jgi:hypothetical protein
MTTIAVQLLPETEEILREKARLHGETLETFLQRVAEREAQSCNGPAQSPERPAPAAGDSWSAQWRNWAASHAKLPAEADDSRQSIYADRGQ